MNRKTNDQEFSTTSKRKGTRKTKSSSSRRKKNFALSIFAFSLAAAGAVAIGLFNQLDVTAYGDRVGPAVEVASGPETVDLKALELFPIPAEIKQSAAPKKLAESLVPLEVAPILLAGSVEPTAYSEWSNSSRGAKNNRRWNYKGFRRTNRFSWRRNKSRRWHDQTRSSFGIPFLGILITYYFLNNGENPDQTIKRLVDILQSDELLDFIKKKQEKYANNETPNQDKKEHKKKDKPHKDKPADMPKDEMAEEDDMLAPPDDEMPVEDKEKMADDMKDPKDGEDDPAESDEPTEDEPMEVASVPEPAAIGFMALALLLFGWLRFRPASGFARIKPKR